MPTNLDFSQILEIGIEPLIKTVSETQRVPVISKKKIWLVLLIVLLVLIFVYRLTNVLSVDYEEGV